MSERSWIIWPKELRERAKQEKKSLIAFGCNGLQQVGLTEPIKATVLAIIYAHMVVQKKTLKAAIAAAKAACFEPEYQECFVGLESIPAAAKLKPKPKPKAKRKK